MPTGTVVCRLDWCNSLLHGVLENLLRKMQNAAARLLTNTRRRDHITPVLRQLYYWLHTNVRLQFLCFCTRPQQVGHPASSVSPKCRSKAHFQPETL